MTTIDAAEAEDIICENCGSTLDMEDLYEHEGHYYCDTCHDNMFLPCIRCGSTYAREDLQLSFDNNWYCEDCYCEVFGNCEHCGNTVYRNDLYLIVDMDIVVCVDCASRDFYYCEDCDENYSDTCRCDDRACIEHKYSYKPKRYHYWRANDSDSDTLFLGFELEIECQPSNKGVIIEKIYKDYEEELYCKQDGTIAYGTEIVSHPATFWYHMDNRERYTKTLQWLISQGCSSYNTNTCGMHVHMSLSAFSGLHLYKFMHFIFHNKFFSLTISQREERLLSRFASLDENEKNIIRTAKEKYNNSNRYIAVNVTTQTAEIRIFRGTLKPQSFFKNLEFCKALFDYTKDATIRELDTTGGFIQFIYEKQAIFPNLYNFLKNKNLIEE